jgi:hypothetical protein
MHYLLFLPYASLNLPVAAQEPLLPDFTPESYSHFWMTAHFEFDYRASKFFSLNRGVQADSDSNFIFFSPASNIILEILLQWGMGDPGGSYFSLVCKY